MSVAETGGSWNFNPFCPFRPGELCNYKCALAVRLNGTGGYVACALAVIAARGSDHSVNGSLGPMEAE